MPRILKILVTLLIISALTFLLGWSSVFTVKKVEYIGIKDRLQISAVEKKVGNLVGAKLARIEPRQLTNTIETLSWIARDHVRRL